MKLLLTLIHALLTKIVCIINYYYHPLYDFYLSLLENFCFLAGSVLVLIIVFISSRYFYYLYFVGYPDSFAYIPDLNYHRFGFPL